MKTRLTRKETEEMVASILRGDPTEPRCGSASIMKFQPGYRMIRCGKFTEFDVASRALGGKGIKYWFASGYSIVVHLNYYIDALKAVKEYESKYQ